MQPLEKQLKERQGILQKAGGVKSGLNPPPRLKVLPQPSPTPVLGIPLGTMCGLTSCRLTSQTLLPAWALTLSYGLNLVHCHMLPPPRPASCSFYTSERHWVLRKVTV